MTIRRRIEMNVSSFKRGTFIFMICIACFGCFRNAPLSKVKGEPYPQSVAEGFMKGCQKQGEAKFCACVFVKIQKQYSLAEFVEIETKLKAGTPTEEFTEFTRNASTECSQDK
jgi:hypothetical protein